MIAIPGYQFQEIIFEGRKTIICRGRREKDGSTVVAKILKKDYPSEADRNWLEYEYRIVRELKLPSVIGAYALETIGHRKAFIMEDFGAVSLKTLTEGKPLDLNRTIDIAIAISSAVAEIHCQRVIHKDIKPDNILINPDTGVLKFIDFGIALQLQRETQPLVSSHKLEGTLAYMSPEQTGRMNRSVDYRSDYYSLGATLYELMTGHRPFEMKNPAELIHAHIARQPRPPHVVRPDLPHVISDIIIKLMAKAPQDRYQSTVGLITDLKTCRQELTLDNTIEPFSIGRSDVPEQFQIPEKLYGRLSETEILFNEFQRVAGGDTRMLLIAGPPGIGKTFLINEIHKPLVGQNGFFISGKFDQLKGNTPYGPFMRAFQDLIRQVLTDPSDRLAQWKAELLEAMGPNARVIVDLIPELELIIGPPPPVPALGLAESLNRFNLTFKKFLRVFARKQHPLVIFIDDWQWADAATLGFLKTLMTDTELHHLFFIGVYRDNEVDARHPFMLLLEEIRQGCQTQITTLLLDPLESHHIEQFASDALRCSREYATPMAALIRKKTGGNPFFIKQFMQSLYNDELLHFDARAGAWSWRLEQVSKKAAAENVVDLMISQFQQLAQSSRKILQLAACIGNQFDLKTLALVSANPPAETFSRLRQAVALGYLLPLDDNYKLLWVSCRAGYPVNAAFRFAHDKIQQAAYALIPREQRQTMHLKIGRLLQDDPDSDAVEARLFDIVDQLNRGGDLINSRREQIELAQLNLKAGLKSKAAAAYQAAWDYLKQGCDLLGQENWEQVYEMVRDLHRERADVAYLLGNFTESEELIRLLLAKVRTDVEKAEVYNLLIVQKTMGAQYGEAIAAGRKALQLLGIALPEADLQSAFETQIQQARDTIGQRTVAELINIAEMTDSQQRLQIRLLTNLCSAAYRSDQSLFRILVLEAVNICLQHGLVVEACYSFSAYGLLLGSILGDFQTGYQFGRLALSISEKFNNPTQKCRTDFVLASTLVHWVQHARKADDVSDEGYKVGLDCGEFQFASYIQTYKLTNQIFQGINLPTMADTTTKDLAFSRQIKNQWAVDVVLGTRLVIANLCDESARETVFADDEVSEAEFLQNCDAHNSHSAACRFHIFKSQALYLYGRYAEARQASISAKKMLAYIFGTIYTAEHNFYDSLIMVRMAADTDEDDRKRYLEQIEHNQKQMSLWAKNCEANYQHRYLLVAAETARLQGDDLTAMTLYDQAIAQAHTHGFIQNEALAYECAARFWLTRNKKEFVAIYLQQAYQGYRQWGAKRKLAQMRALHPDLMETLNLGTGQPKTATLVNATVTSADLELDTITRALQAISSEIVLENLLARLMSIVVVEAGADHGQLFLRRNQGLILEAEIQGPQMATKVLQAVPMESSRTAKSMVRYVARTRETIVSGNAPEEPLFAEDPYIRANRPPSVLCMPIVRQDQLQAVLYVENRMSRNVFTPQRRKVLTLLASQAAISLENALLFDELTQEITERRRVEHALRESKDRFRDLTDLLPQAIYEADREGRLTFMNRAGFASFGITPEDIKKGLSFHEMVVPEDQNRIAHNIQKILGGHISQGNPYTLQRKDGSRFQVVAYSNRVLKDKDVIGLRGIIIDVTHLRRTEAQLKNTRNYLHNLFNTLPSILIAVDRNGMIRQWNIAAELFSDRPAREVLRQNLWDQAPFLTKYKQDLTSMFQSGRTVARYHEKLKAGDKKYFDIFFYPLSDEGGQGALIRMDDVTEMVTKDEQLRQAQKMETIGSLAGGIAHDFNNVLSGITGTLSLIRHTKQTDHALSPDKLARYLAIMENAALRASDLVQQLLTLSRKQELSMTVFDLNQTVQNVINICNNTLDKSIEIDTRYHDENAMVEADPTQIEQVLLNLCVNAAHAMTLMRSSTERQGGILTVSVQHFTADKPYCGAHLRAEPGPYWILRIQDTGVGMPPEIMPRIFDPFYTTKEMDEGTGLGLAMVYNIIKQHKGFIEVFSEVKTGSTINVFLPVADKAALQEEETEPLIDMVEGGGSILIVDDEEIVRITAKGILEQVGYKTILAKDGQQGLEIFREKHTEIISVLLDMAMPKKSGQEVYVEMKQIDPQVRVLLSSGFRQDSRVQETLDLGVTGFIQKPYSMAKLIKAMGEVINSDTHITSIPIKRSAL